MDDDVVKAVCGNPELDRGAEATGKILRRQHRCQGRFADEQRWFAKGDGKGAIGTNEPSLLCDFPAQLAHAFRERRHG